MFDQLALFRLPIAAASSKSQLVQIGSRLVEYTLRRAARRRLTMAIDERGLRLSAPLHMAQSEIEGFIVKHGAWVQTKLDEYAARSSVQHVRIQDGCALPFLGRQVQIRILPGKNRIRWVGDTLVLEARPDSDLQLLTKRGLQRRALPHFVQSVAHYAQQMSRLPPPLRLSNARTRWGSCSSKSGLHLNWRLIHLPQHIVDYVVVHELSHLVEMNHSPRFWAQVERYYPQWREARLELRTLSNSIPSL